MTRSAPATLLLTLLGLAPLGASAQKHDLPAAIDLRAEAGQAARQGSPLVLLYTRRDCKYCESVKRDFLKPLAANPSYRDRVVIRQVNQDSDGALGDFGGKRTTHAAFAASQKVKLVPVVAFYGPDGRQLADPIVGARLPDFYQAYLEEGIEKSALALKSR
jgi:thioredoxin-related protein